MNSYFLPRQLKNILIKNSATLLYSFFSDIQMVSTDKLNVISIRVGCVGNVSHSHRWYYFIMFVFFGTSYKCAFSYVIVPYLLLPWTTFILTTIYIHHIIYAFCWSHILFINLWVNARDAKTVSSYEMGKQTNIPIFLHTKSFGCFVNHVIYN